MASNLLEGGSDGDTSLKIFIVRKSNRPQQLKGRK